MVRAIALVTAILGLFGAWYLVLPTGKPEKDYPLTGFNRLEISDGVWAKIYTGQEGGVRAQVLRGDLEELLVEKTGGTLKISVHESDHWLGPWVHSRYQLTIWMPEIKSIVTDNHASVEVVTGLVGDLTAEARDGSNLLISEIFGDDIAARASEKGSLTLYGVCNSLRAEAETEGYVGAQGLECLQVSADSRSEGEVEVRAMETADLNAMGGQISLSGSAVVGRSRAILGGEIHRR